jgi:hypothetical protein
MERKTLTTMLRIANDVVIDGVCDSVSIDDLNQLIFDLQIAIEKHDLKDFLVHVEDAMPINDDEQAWDDFYNKSFRITFDHKCVEIPNNADTYQSIVDLIKTYIEDQYLDGPAFVKSRNMYGHLMYAKTCINRLKELETMDVIDLDSHLHNLHGLKDKMYEIIDDLLEYFK